MRLTTKGRYAVTAMIDLGLRSDGSALTLHEIAKKQDISLSYLEQLFAGLRRHGLVSGTRGPGGGYRLAKDASEISVADVIVAVDEKVDITNCNGRGDCKDGEQCLTHELWTNLSCMLYEFMDSIKLSSLLETANDESKVKMRVAAG
ncbi:MAG TPA: Rrf2 family transcriptional regulator [Gammaproteobacteria bacterium]|nr:Rrf2 family transcriptional regulator [Gammaproteobacteria bacterium]